MELEKSQIQQLKILMNENDTFVDPYPVSDCPWSSSKMGRPI